MSSDSLHHFNALPLTIRHAIDQLCLRFEADWLSGAEPSLEQYLGEVAADHHPALLTELLTLELEYRRQRGQQPRPEDYSRRFPHLTPVVQELFSSGPVTPPYPPTPAGEAKETPVAPSGRPGADWPQIPGLAILSVLGRGGMGVVYRARQISLNRLVALKMIRTAGRHSLEERIRFRLEAEAVAQLHHANIVQVHECGEHQGQPYLVLELVEGGSLDQALGEPLPPRASGKLVETLARAVHHAHSRGIIHRDLKPGNILLQSNSATDEHRLNTDKDNSPLPLSVFNLCSSVANSLVKITDFGLAKRMGTDPGQTQDGQIVGTPAYMAPEQAGGDPNQIGIAVDIYALGVILYQLLTGRVPLKGKDGLDTLLLVQDQEPTPPRRLRPSIPRDLEIICLKCLNKQPQQRYATAQDLADDLRRFLIGVPIQARPAGPVERLWKWTRRNPVLSPLLATITLLVVAVAVISTTAVFQLRRQEAQRKIERVEALLVTAPESVPYILDSLKDDAKLAIPRLRQEFEEAGDAREDAAGRRLRAAVALTVLGEPKLEYLLDAVPKAPAAESGNLALAFRHWPDESGPLLLQCAQKAVSLTHRARCAILLLDLGDLAAVQPMLAAVADPAPRSTVIELLPTWHGNLAALPDLLRQCDDEACRSGLCAAVGGVEPATLTPAVGRNLAAALRELYRTDPDGGTHSAADWAMRQWRLPLPDIEPTPQPLAGRRWFVNGAGLTMIGLRPGSFLLQSTVMVLTRPFFLSNREVSVQLFQQFLNDPDYSREAKPQDWPGRGNSINAEAHCPVTFASHSDIVLFCNWLSRREGRTPCYHQTAPGSWMCDQGTDGYRLPTEAEWDYAHRAGSTTKFFFGNDTRWLTSYANVATLETLPCGSKIPNRWGLFDTTGNLWELCEDSFGPLPNGVVINPKGPASPAEKSQVRTSRGGAFDSGTFSTISGNRLSGGNRSPSTGFRVACAEPAAAAGRDVRAELRQGIEGARLALNLQPDNVAWLHARAELYVRLGHWKEAADDLGRVLEREPNKDWTWYERSPLLILAQDEAGYRQHCRQMLDRYADTRVSLVAERVVKSSLLLPATGEDLEAAHRLIESALARSESLGPMRKYVQMSQGIALYRSGNWAEALTALSQSQQSPLDQHPIPRARALAAVYEAMAWWQLGHEPQARQALDRGFALVENVLVKMREGESEGHWVDYLMFEIVLGEAQRLMQAGP